MTDVVLSLWAVFFLFFFLRCHTFLLYFQPLHAKLQAQRAVLKPNDNNYTNDGKPSFRHSELLARPIVLYREDPTAQVQHPRAPRRSGSTGGPRGINMYSARARARWEPTTPDAVADRPRGARAALSQVVGEDPYDSGGGQGNPTAAAALARARGAVPVARQHSGPQARQQQGHPSRYF
ncbi:hypothetical protein T492DRAFT_1142044 [Pavlovales sp. CCMP2436]|nr:hypothetical protein T492DRAFT_1142044 [Pavlovales sp. CCMP2436]